MSGEGHKENGFTVLGAAQREAILKPACTEGNANTRLLCRYESNTLTTAFRTVAASIIVPALAAVHTTAHLLDSTSVNRRWAGG